MNRLMKVRNKHSLETRLEPIQQIFTPPPLKIVKFLNRIWDFHKNDLGQLKKNGIPVKTGEISCLIYTINTPRPFSETTHTGA